MNGKRVCCIGNMNNNFFSLVRYLRDRGLDVDLFLLNTDLDFCPADDSFDDDFESYTKRLSWGDLESFLNFSPERISKDLASYNYLIGCGSAPAFVAKCGRQLDVFSPYGSDIYDLPFYDFSSAAKSYPRMRDMVRYQLGTRKFASWQRIGIAAARHIICDNEVWREQFDQIGIAGKYVTAMLPSLYLDAYIGQDTNMQSFISPLISRAKSLREQNSLILSFHLRHVWADNPDIYSRKGVEWLLEGFAQFIRTAPKNCTPAILTFEYGPDVDRSKKLIAELGIEEHVHWFRRARRKDLMSILALADIGCGEFFQNWLVSGATLEMMASSLPIIQYRDTILSQRFDEDLYPSISARDPAEIAGAIHELAEDKKKRDRMGRESIAWVRRHCATRGVDAFVEALS